MKPIGVTLLFYDFGMLNAYGSGRVCSFNSYFKQKLAFHPVLQPSEVTAFGFVMIFPAYIKSLEPSLLAWFFPLLRYLAFTARSKRLIGTLLWFLMSC